MIESKIQKHRNKPNRMNNAEIMVILILVLLRWFPQFQALLQKICLQTSATPFPTTGFYNRFVELKKKVLLPLTILIKKILLGPIGLNFVNSILRVCCSLRILVQKTFEELTERGKCSMGCFLVLSYT